MRHRVKKIKFRAGKDANKMLLRKLTKNFIAKGKIVTTVKKAKVLKTVLDRLIGKTRVDSKANRRYLLERLGDKVLVSRLFSHVGPSLKNLQSGFVRISRLGIRLTDGSVMAKLEWSIPIVLEEKTKKEVEKKVTSQTQTKDEPLEKKKKKK